MTDYLVKIPESAKDSGICKVLTVRREVIHIKHIMTEVFVRKSINIDYYLNTIGWSTFDYISYLTNRIRKIHKFSRGYIQDLEKIVGMRYSNFFPSIEFLSGLSTLIALDFDGVVTENKFRDLYLNCLDKSKTEIFSANPNVMDEWFIKRSLPTPSKINSRKGKVSKIKALIEAAKNYDMVFYVDNEKEYLDFAFLFGIRTYQYTQGKIKYYSIL